MFEIIYNNLDIFDGIWYILYYIIYIGTSESDPEFDSLLNIVHFYY